MVEDPLQTGSSEEADQPTDDEPIPDTDLPVGLNEPGKLTPIAPLTEATPVQGDDVSAVIPVEGQLGQIVRLDSSECNAMFAGLQERASTCRRVALAMDGSGALGLPILAVGEETTCLEFDRRLSLNGVLSRLSKFTNLNNFMFGGSVETMLALAAGTPTGQDQLGKSFESDFLAALGTRLYLDVAIVQSLREVRTSPELLHLLNRRRLGWLVDEICRQACLQIRLYLHTIGTLETIAFGSTGAVIGRAHVEPGSFLL